MSITADDVFFDLVASRPVYVHGDVGEPGEVTYRPDLSVRQAVTLAGGYDVARLRQADPFIEMENARTDYAALWIAFAHQQATVWRLEAELQGRDDIGHDDIPAVPIDPELVSQILRTEKKQLSLDLSDHALDRQQLAKTLKETERQIDTLEERDDMQTAELAAARAELDNLKVLDKKGLAQSTRISDARRAILLTSSQQLETTVEKLRATVERDALARRYDTLDAEREVALLKALKDARLELETTRTGLRSAGQKLLYAGLLQSDLVRRHAPADIIIHRSDPEGEPQSLPASEDAPLMPGDVVEVKLELPRELFTTRLN
ncbi:polysaccharide export outer membrane protein [Rhodopseudomonas julia]|uniref:Polysaccharide export outer membrane protein n=1 Tax=Rhodopseudomonas julia TaxID=200617 RepID=A0ABU0C5T4_9BRAD|nr:polysaccharide export outer membrane protein [Rhodopseudomonas julia]